MIPKLENGYHSLQSGVKQVFVTNVKEVGKENTGGTELVI
jgi:hypothetical protein